MSEISPYDLLAKLQLLQDMLSEYLDLCLCLIDSEINEVTLPSGLPLDCHENESNHIKKCKFFYTELVRSLLHNKQPFTSCCPNGLYVNVSITNFTPANKPIFLVCGRTKNLDNLEKHLHLLHTIYLLPINYPFQPHINNPSVTIHNKIYFDLTPQENNILTQIVAGLSNKDIATKLCISQSTVKTHIANIFKKIGVNNRTEAAFLALKKQIIGDN